MTSTQRSSETTEMWREKERGKVKLSVVRNYISMKRERERERSSVYLCPLKEGETTELRIVVSLRLGEPTKIPSCLLTTSQTFEPNLSSPVLRIPRSRAYLQFRLTTHLYSAYLSHTGNL